MQAKRNESSTTECGAFAHCRASRSRESTCCLPLEDRFYLRFQVAAARIAASEGAAGFAEFPRATSRPSESPSCGAAHLRSSDGNGPPVAIVNQTLARQFWPNGDPLDGQIIVGNEAAARSLASWATCATTPSISTHARWCISLSAPSSSSVAATPWAWVIRTREAPMSLSAAIQKELREASGGLPVAPARTMEEVLSRSTAAGDFNALVLTIFGCSALFLAAIGIYGLMAYSVTQRTQELGIRMALGAESSQIRNMVALNGLRLALAGVVCGLAMAFGLTRLLAGSTVWCEALGSPSLLRCSGHTGRRGADCRVGAGHTGRPDRSDRRPPMRIALLPFAPRTGRSR